MTNVFLKVNKDFFKLGLNPTEILILAQVMEYNTNTNNCFMSDKAFAELFGVSDKTISRALKVLEDKGFIKRETKNVKGGKERHIYIQVDKIEQALPKDNLSVVESDDKNSQGTKCLLSKDNLSVVKGQNDLIKDNIKDNLKDNNGISSAETADEIQESVPGVEEITMEQFKALYAQDLVFANTNQLETKGIITIFGKTYKIKK